MKVQPLLADRLLPLEVRPQGEGQAEALTAWLRDHRAEVLAWLREAGALLFRGFKLRDAQDFAAVIAAFDEQPRAYVGGQSPRTPVGPRVYTSTEYPATERIPLHHELSYTADPPAFLAFFCERPAEIGGLTPILDGRRFLEALPDALRGRFEGRGLRYLKAMHGGAGVGLGRSWQQHFETEDRDQVEDWLRRDGALWRWTEDGGLRTEHRRPALARHPITGELTWFNQATLWHVSWLGARGRALQRMLEPDALPTNVTYDDGAPLDVADLDALRDLEWRCATHFHWQPGDLLLLDNHLVAHGRGDFRGARRVLVSMGDGPVDA